MSYHGYLPLLKNALRELKHQPAILEVGVDRGVTFVTLASFLARTHPQFLMVGVDILIQEQVQIMVQNLDLTKGQQAYLLQQNSLQALPSFIDQGMKFDVILLDGDHNYYTVQNELAMLDSLAKSQCVVVIDDYDGRWSERDLWYSERPGYEDVKNATLRTDTEKHGVKAAVDEFVAKNNRWALSKPISGEPVVLTRL